MYKNFSSSWSSHSSLPSAGATVNTVHSEVMYGKIEAYVPLTETQNSDSQALPISLRGLVLRSRNICHAFFTDSVFTWTSHETIQMACMPSHAVQLCLCASRALLRGSLIRSTGHKLDIRSIDSRSQSILMQSCLLSCPRGSGIQSAWLAPSSDRWSLGLPACSDRTRAA